MKSVLVVALLLSQVVSLKLEARPRPEAVNKPPAVQVQVGYADAKNLFKVAVTATGSFDPDGTITKTEIDLGDGSSKKVYDGKFVKNDAVLNHTYARAGKFTVTVTHTDNKGLAQAASKIVEVIQVSSLTKSGVTFGPKKYRANSNTYTETINRSAAQAKDFYRITFKNGDGKEYAEENCTNLGFFDRIRCLIRNARAVVYKNATRARDITFTINNENIVREEEFTINTLQLVKYVRLSTVNQLRLRVQGLPSAAVEMLIEQMSPPVGDIVAPVLASNIKSNAFTNINKIHISISDQSAVSTQVFKSGTLISTQTSKEFDISLTEGVNNFVLKSVDASQNKAADFVLSNITLDTVVPKLSSNVNSNAVTKVNKVSIAIVDQSAVSTQIFKNGTLVGTESAKVFDLTLTEGANSFTLKTTDAAQNKSVDLALTNIILDTTAPKLVSALNSNALTNASKFKITITDSTNVTTQVFKNGVLQSTQTAKTFDLTLTEGSNSFTLKAVDVAQNKAADFVLTNITLDTVAPKLASNVASGTITKSNKITITVTDVAAVSTQVFKNGVLQSTQTAKSFDLTLAEGVNNFTLKATDAAQNKSLDFVLSNITLDTLAPSLASAVSSNSLTNVNKVRITITDPSAVTTQVFKNGTLVKTETVKSFDLALTEGSNSFVLKAVDQVQNKAADFTLSNITLDSIAPKLASNVSSNATVTNNKVSITITDAASVTTQVFKNGVLQSTQVGKSFELSLTTGANSFTLKSVDAAQNKAADFVLMNIVLQAGDTTVPMLAVSVSSGVFTSNNKISVTITDQSSVTTQVFRSGVLIATEQSKSFQLTLVEGLNNFVLKAVDAAQNKAPDLVLSNITLDSVLPTIASSLPANSLTNNSVVHFTITDASSVTTQVIGNGMVMLNTNSKSFDINLFEGSFSYSVATTDKAGNTVTSYLQYTLDSIRPVLTADLKSQYIFDTLPQLQTITIGFNEAVHNVTLNNALAIQVGPFQYSYTLQFDQPGTKPYVFKALDLAGNEIVVQQDVTILLDHAAPVIATNVIPAVITTNEFDLAITITENSSVTTEVYVDDQLKLTSNSKSFTYKVMFDQAEQIQVRKINIVSKDAANNQSNSTFTITKDLSPLLVQIISPQNQSILNSPVVEVRARANKPLVAAKVNGQVVPISSDQLSVRVLLQQPADGKFSVLVEVTDVSGAKSSHQVEAEVKSNSLPSWTYEECRAE